MGEEMAKMGLQGIEATIRRGRHIEPLDAAKKMSGMVASLAKNGCKALIAACNVGSTGKGDWGLSKFSKPMALRSTLWTTFAMT